ncbi:hypothetical protein ES288_A07G100500v1, partial [Gossypium darwinii]
VANLSESEGSFTVAVGGNEEKILESSGNESQSNWLGDEEGENRRGQSDNCSLLFSDNRRGQSENRSGNESQSNWLRVKAIALFCSKKSRTNHCIHTLEYHVLNPTSSFGITYPMS